MWHIPSNPQDHLKSELEYENFIEQRSEQKKFFDEIKRIADGANQKSTFATVLSIISVLISLATFVLELVKYLN